MSKGVGCDAFSARVQRQQGDSHRSVRVHRAHRPAQTDEAMTMAHRDFGTCYTRSIDVRDQRISIRNLRSRSVTLSKRSVVTYLCWQRMSDSVREGK